MFDKNCVLAADIKNKILSRFIDAEINIFFDKERNEYFISTRDKDLYYSEEFGMLVFEINQGILWKQGIFNFYFILDLREREFINAADKISFSRKNETAYASWDINSAPRIFADKHIDTGNFSLAA